MNFKIEGQTLSEADIVRLAKEIQNKNNPSVLTTEEQQIIDDYRILTRSERSRVRRLIAELMDHKYGMY